MPDLHDTLFELGEEALFLETAERRTGSKFGVEMAVGSDGRSASVDGCLGGDQVVGC